jgi:hypothetical protein
MGRTQAPPLTVVRPGEGRAGELGGLGVVFKLWGQDTGGALSIVEHPFADHADLRGGDHSSAVWQQRLANSPPLRLAHSPSAGFNLHLTQAAGVECQVPWPRRADSPGQGEDRSPRPI